MKLIKPEEEQEEEEEDGDQNPFDANIMKLVQTNILTNFGIDERQIEDEEEDEKSGYEDDMEQDDEDDGVDEDEEEDDEMGNFINFKNFGDRGADNVSYITSMFQNFVNKTLQNSS